MKNALVPVFQPIVDMKSGDVALYEVLARTRTVSDGHRRLIELGENYGFISAIDVAMLEHSIDVLKSQSTVVLAVNCSVLTIEQSSNELLSLIYRHMDLADRLVFEITETVPIRDKSRLNRFMAAARLICSRVAVDDFGNGHFTFTQLREIRPDFIKLSGRLVNDLRGMHGVVREVMSVASEWGGVVVAEQVDTAEKLAALRQLGVAYAQGYYLGAPAESIEEARARTSRPLRIAASAGA